MSAVKPVNDFHTLIADEIMATHTRTSKPEEMPQVQMHDARRLLTRLVRRAEYKGESTVITLNGRPVALIAPIPNHEAA